MHGEIHLLSAGILRTGSRTPLGTGVPSGKKVCFGPSSHCFSLLEDTKRQLLGHKVTHATMEINKSVTVASRRDWNWEMRKSGAFSAETWRLGRNYSGEEGGGEGMGSVQRFQAEQHMRGPRGQQGTGPSARTQSWCVWLEHRLCELKKKGLKRKAEAISSVVSKSQEGTT